MNRRYGMLSNARGLMRTYKSAECTNNYFSVKTEIEQKINNFNRIKHRNIYAEWDKLNKHIITKDQGLKYCYENGYIPARLNNEEKIINFKKKCNSDGTCNNGASPARKPPIIKPTTQGTCKENKGCKNETPERVNVKSHSRFVSGATDSKSSEIKNPQEQGQNLANGQKSRQEGLLSQSQSISMPSGSSARTHGDASQDIVDHHPTTSVELNTQKQMLDASIPSEISEPGSPLSHPSSQCISGDSSDLTCTSIGKSLDTQDIQTNQRGGQTLDTNNPETEDSAGDVIVEQTGGDQDITSGTTHILSPTGSTPSPLQRADNDPLPTAPGGESNNDKDSQDHSHYIEGSCNGIPCNATENTEITADNNKILDILSYTFNAIQQNKDNMITASIPMGILLLLTLIFKVN
ncbi:VIR protein [Plasmodium vivax]|uniref:VIR protein n=1 Tax=Plasmodium vivax TaxID=5855 RepID=A0A1G4H2N1_PLAVI|nr:VIR protein [Plasmodium vivax]